MTRQSPLEALIDMAKDRVDSATRRLAECLAGERTAAEKLQLLTDYREEYRKRYMEAVRNGMGPADMRNYSAFLAKLDDAILQQQQVTDHQKRLTVAGQQQWMQERNRLKAFDTLSQRQLQQQQRKENKQEQRQSDEHAAKHFKSGEDEHDQ
ncbi:flagellar export protein FliJ [Uliginosibacterium sp. H1]|uniref:flagellar export protein FliJ n=1 Tax=Uliginosibacterium sp. H1 TaxID=3114757 RepID=UPI002E17A370|nr:flagellar export protein FliJ [Uliginosibacterium sp. H1]